jgi:hypothetical protein
MRMTMFPRPAGSAAFSVSRVFDDVHTYDTCSMPPQRDRERRTPHTLSLHVSHTAPLHPQPHHDLHRQHRSSRRTYRVTQTAAQSDTSHNPVEHRERDRTHNDTQQNELQKQTTSGRLAASTCCVPKYRVPLMCHLPVASREAQPHTHRHTTHDTLSLPCA